MCVQPHVCWRTNIHVRGLAMSISKKLKHLPLLLAGVAMGLGVFINFNSSKKVEPVDASVGNYTTNASTYYNGITATSGKQLAAQLHDLITSTHKTYTTYADNGANLYQAKTDQYYENDSAVNGYIYEFYSGAKWSSTWVPNNTGGYNREHCWCQSNSVPTGSSTRMWGEDGGGADMHHLRPVEKDLNSTRNNNLYGEVSNRDNYKKYPKQSNGSYSSSLGGYCNGGIFEPIDSKKGDVARIILYVYIHYNSYTVSSLFGSYGTTNGNSNFSSYFTSSLLPLTNTIKKDTESDAINLLLSWNSLDPVDAIEQRRNEQVAKYQGNRNPFIDNSNYANMIWGSGSTTPTVNYVNVSPTTLNLDLNGTKTGTLTATVNVSNGAAQTVSWSSSNVNVATVNNGTVTAKAKGSCTITATSTVDSSKSASCSVKVVNSSGGGSSSSNEYELYSGGLTSGKYIVFFNNKAMNTSVNNGRLQYETVTPSNDKITTDLSSIIWNIQQSGQYWTLYNESASGYAASTGIDNKAQILSSGTDDKSLWTVSGTSTYEFVNKYNKTNSKNSNLRNNGEYGFACYSTSTGGALSLYKQNTSSGDVTLTSISLNTNNVQTEFYVDDVFDYSGLIVTAHYSDNTEDIVSPSSISAPDMSCSGEKTIIVSYAEGNVTKTATYTINVLDYVITEISASVNKIYHPGERILSSDIVVEDNFDRIITNFNFTNNNYQFTYSDAAGGGNLTDKVFANSISSSGQTCSLTVQVQRKEYVSQSSIVWQKVTDASSLEVGNIIIIADSGNSLALSTEQRTYNRGAAVITKSNNIITWETATYEPQQLTLTSTSGINNAPSGSFGLSTGDGYLYAASSSNNNLKTQSTNNINGAFVISIENGVTTIIATASSYTRNSIRSNYSNNPSIFSCYEKDATTGNAVEVYRKTENSQENPVNLANYIMFEDTNNQCKTKLYTAIGYLGNLNPTDLSTFASSPDYVISTARTRLNAWALHEGKTINYANATLSNRSSLTIFENTQNNNATTMIIIVSLLGVTSIGFYLYIRRKEGN